MGGKLAWAGLAILLGFPALGIGGFITAGGVLLVAGAVLIVLDK